jgi:hypothetical protein
MAQSGTATIGGGRGGGLAVGGRSGGSFGAAGKGVKSGPVISIGSKEGGSFGGGKPTFSSRIFAETAPFAGPKAGISGEKFTIRSGESPRKTGLGDKAFALGQGRTRNASPETRGWNPLSLPEFNPQAPRGRDIIQRTGKFGLPSEITKQPQAQPSPETVRKIVSEIGREYGKTHGIDIPAIKPLGQPEVRPTIPGVALPTAQEVAGRARGNEKPLNPRGRLNVEEIRGELKKIDTETQKKPGLRGQVIRVADNMVVADFDNLPIAKESSVKRLVGTSSALGYLNLIRQREQVKLDENQEEDTPKKKQTFRHRTQGVLQALQKTINQGIKGLVPDEKALPKTDPQAQIATISQQAEGLKLSLKQTVGQAVQTQLAQEASSIAVPLAQRIERTEAQAQALVQTQIQAKEEEVAVETEAKKADPEEEQKALPPSERWVPLRVDENAAQARAYRVLTAFEEKAQTVGDSSIPGYTFSDQINLGGEEVISAALKYGGADLKGATTIDGSLEPTRNAIRGLHSVNRGDARKVIRKIVQDIPPIDFGKGRGVSKDAARMVLGEAAILRSEVLL